MATVFTLGNSEGERRCDDACLFATQPTCTCVCGGKYHGAALKPGGLEAVQRDVAQHLAEHIEDLGPLFAHAKGPRNGNS